MTRRQPSPLRRAAEVAAIEQFLSAGKTTVCPDGAAAGAPLPVQLADDPGLAPMLSAAPNSAPAIERRAARRLDKRHRQKGFARQSRVVSPTP